MSVESREWEGRGEREREGRRGEKIAEDGHSGHENSAKIVICEFCITNWLFASSCEVLKYMRMEYLTDKPPRCHIDSPRHHYIAAFAHAL